DHDTFYGISALRLDGVCWNIANEVRLPQLPGVKVDMGSHFFWSQGACILHIEKHRSSVTWPEAFNPGHDKLRFPEREAVVVCKLAVTRKRWPRRHMARDDFRADFTSAKPGLLVCRQRKRRTVFDVTHHAVLIEDTHDLAIEQYRGRECFVRKQSRN